MNESPSIRKVVLRNALLQTGAVRIGRAYASQVPTARSMTVALSVEPMSPSPQDLFEEAMRAATEEGLKQGRAEGLRSGMEEGRREGYEEGMASGHAAAQADAQKALDIAVADATLALEQQGRQLATLAKALEAAAAAYQAEAEEELVALVYEVLARILGEVLLTADGLEAQVRQLLAAIGPSAQPAVHLNPQDLQQLEQSRTDSTPATRLRYVADERVAFGGCILRGAGAGELDARLETILQECKAALLQSRAVRDLTQAGATGTKGNA